MKKERQIKSVLRLFRLNIEELDSARAEEARTRHIFYKPFSLSSIFIICYCLCRHMVFSYGSRTIRNQLNYYYIYCFTEKLRWFLRGHCLSRFVRYCVDGLNENNISFCCCCERCAYECNWQSSFSIYFWFGLLLMIIVYIYSDVYHWQKWWWWWCALFETPHKRKTFITVEVMPNRRNAKIFVTIYNGNALNSFEYWRNRSKRDRQKSTTRQKENNLRNNQKQRRRRTEERYVAGTFAKLNRTCLIRRSKKNGFDT